MKTVTLAPREERAYVTRSTWKRAATAVRATAIETQRRSESQDSTRSAADIVSAARLLRIVREHGVPEVVAGTRVKVADHIRSEWSNHLRGTTAPPGLGLALYRKCAFLSHRILSEGGGDAALIANVVLHEFGHMNNIMRSGYAHPSDGSVMQTRLVTSALQSHVRPFNEQHAADILRQIDILWSIEQSLRPSP